MQGCVFGLVIVHICVHIVFVNACGQKHLFLFQNNCQADLLLALKTNMSPKVLAGLSKSIVSAKSISSYYIMWHDLYSEQACIHVVLD